MSFDPDAPSESTSEYDGLFSYSTEYHSAVIGGTAGFLPAVLDGTQYEPFGFAAMASVAGVALGLNRIVKKINPEAAQEIQKEPWYALGAMLLVYVAVAIATTA